MSASRLCPLSETFLVLFRAFIQAPSPQFDGCGLEAVSDPRDDGCILILPTNGSEIERDKSG